MSGAVTGIILFLLLGIVIELFKALLNIEWDKDKPKFIPPEDTKNSKDLLKSIDNYNKNLASYEAKVKTKKLAKSKKQQAIIKQRRAIVLKELAEYMNSLKINSIKTQAIFDKESRNTTNVSSTYDVDEFRLMKQQYLNSPKWQVKRTIVLERDHYTCQHCGDSNCELHVHHKCGYGDIPNESTDCLITLCRDCHQAIHDKYGYPQTIKQYHNWKH